MPNAYIFHFPFSTDNPYNCSCDSQPHWQWIKDHQKIMHSTERFIKCETPLSLRGRPFATVTPEEFCPLITEVTIDDIQRYSVVVSWQHREHTGLSGFEIFYQAIDGGVDDVSPFSKCYLNRFKIFNSNQLDCSSRSRFYPHLILIPFSLSLLFPDRTITDACERIRTFGQTERSIFRHSIPYLCDWFRKSPIVGHDNVLCLEYGCR